MVEWIFNVYQSKVIRTLYNRVKLFFKWLNNFGDMWIFSFLKWAKSEKFAKNRRVLKCRPPICVYENGHWYQCVALCELVWMHCVDFLILDLLKRYRQNTDDPALCVLQCFLHKAVRQTAKQKQGCKVNCKKKQ